MYQASGNRRGAIAGSHARVPPIAFKRQHGLGLVELAIASAVLSVIILYGLLEFINQVESRKARAQGEILKSYATVLDEYILRFSPELIAGNPGDISPVNTTVNGVPVVVNLNLFAPTFAMLQQLGFIDENGINSTGYDPGPGPGGYLFSVRKLNNCNATSPSCKLDGFVFLGNPVTSLLGEPSYALAGEVALIAGDSGVSGLTNNGQDPERVYGPQGTWEVIHPAANGTPARVAATVAIRTNNAGGAFVQYLRRDGTSFMTGDLLMSDVANGAPLNDILGAGRVELTDLAASGSASIAGATSVGGNLDVLGNAAITGQITGRSLELVDNLLATDIEATNNIKAGGNIEVDGEMAVDDVYVRSRGQWLSQLLSDFVVVETRIVDLSIPGGNIVTKPTCREKGQGPTATIAAQINETGRAGIPLIYAFPIKGDIASATEVSATLIQGNPDQVVVDNTKLALGRIQVEAQDLGAQWQILSSGLTELDGAGNTINYAADFSVIAQIVCKYNN